jgi:medium-chain acyl-[acyl-carrier-protein] hydrolase
MVPGLFCFDVKARVRMASSSDFFVPQPRPGAALRLLCFPHAGGAPTAFFPWNAPLGPEIECVSVQYPGRGQRFREEPLNSISDLADEISTRLTDFSDKPLAFYGHSFGGLVAFELARRLRQLGRTSPQHLFVGASRPPHLESPFSPIHTLPENEFVEALQARYGGIPAAIYNDREILNVFVAAMRADFTAYELYFMEHEAPLHLPITAFAGAEDQAVTAASMQEWAMHTNAEFELKVLPGAHFFPNSSIATLIQMIRDQALLRVASPVVETEAEGTSACR